MAFEDIYKEMNILNQNNKGEMVKVIPKISQSPLFNNNILLKTIRDIPNMTDGELRNFISNNFLNILNNVFYGEKAQEYIQYFTDIKFLDAFIDVLQTNQFYDNDIIVRINNICYDYLTLKTEMKNSEVINRMIRISNIINRINIPRLLGLGLRNDLVSFILIARYSSFKMNICIKRVNFIIITQPKTLMTTEMILEIFRIIYPTPEIWERIFQYFMVDVIPEYNENDVNALWVTESVEEINSRINLAILEILNEQPHHIIRGALINYAEAYRIININKPIRFTMQKLSDDYDRINSIIQILNYDENILVP
jgi:hypothetical protein